ncbi:MAG: Flp pilus assembly protein CpaB [Planctomycetota bacterium]
MSANKLLGAIAVVSGLVAFLLAFFLIQAGTGSAAAEQSVSSRTKTVLFANADLPAGALLSEGDVIEEEVPLDLPIARRAIQPADKPSIIGKRLSQPVTNGSPLLYSYLAEVRDLDFSTNMRAMTIRVDETSTHAGLLMPEDMVDVIVSRPAPPPPPQANVDPAAMQQAATSGQDLNSVIAGVVSQAMAGSSIGGGTTEQWISETVLSNVRVLAVGNRLYGTRRQLAVRNVEDEMLSLATGDAKTVTLEVTAEDARTLLRVGAGGKNKFTLLLRSTRPMGSTSESDDPGV